MMVVLPLPDPPIKAVIPGNIERLNYEKRFLSYRKYTF
jgi:hypothetical protein